MARLIDIRQRRDCWTLVCTWDQLDDPDVHAAGEKPAGGQRGQVAPVETDVAELFAVDASGQVVRVRPFARKGNGYRAAIQLRCPPSWHAEFHTVANAAALRVLPLGGYDCAVRQDIDDGTARPMKRGLERDRVRCVFEACGGERAESRRT
jgi:hypothetical protein